MIKLFKIMMAGLVLTSPAVIAQNRPIYLDDSKPIEQRVEDALSRMTLKEKVAMIHAQSKFSSAGVPRLGIPDNWMSDGPHGIRNEVLWDEWYGAGWTNDSCTAFPALTCLSATWNPQMSFLYGKSIGEEARFRNKNVLLGPGVNICRTPLNGRNFEYFGEDPYLTSQMVVPYIKGVQDNGVAACVKHYALNNQEKYRGEINVNVDDRALHEIYLPAFKAAVEQGHAWALMGSYNQYKNQHCCHNEYLLNNILKGDWKFDGVVISDWGGTHDIKQAVENGLDMEFGTWTNGLNWSASNAYDNYYLAAPYLEMIQKGEFTEKELNDKVHRILRLEFRTNMNRNRPFGSFGSEEHVEAGRKIIQEGAVLLKNDKNVLPLNPHSIKHLLVVGENAVKRLTIGGGSSSLKVRHEISPLEGILARAAKENIDVSYAKGYESPAVAEQDLKGAQRPKEKIINSDSLLQAAIDEARKADAVIFVGGLNKNEKQDCEGDDRLTLSLPYGQDKLIAALAEVSPRLSVVLLTGSCVTMPWLQKVPAVLEAWYGGSAAGNGIADILFGDINPSGRLPFTFYANLNQCSANKLGDYPGDGKNETYKEGLFVGYRYIDQKKLKPLFPFGFGLSYTTFKYGKLTADKKNLQIGDSITFRINITNTGKCAGAEVIQLYIGENKPLFVRPQKELKGFTKVYLQAGETKEASITIGKDALSYYDDQKQMWVVDSGSFQAFVGASSQDIRSNYHFEVSK
jgi:conserved repeat domain